MTQIVHTIAHILTAIAAVSILWPLTLERALVAGIAGILPDMDTYLNIQHRTATHSLTAVAGIYLLAWSTQPPDPAIPAIATIAYASHIALDMLHSVTPIQIAWPMRYMASIQQVNITPTTATLIALAAISLSLYHPAPAAALLPTPPPATPTHTPTSTRTPTNTTTPTNTRTPTTPTPTDTPDHWGIEIARLRAEQARASADYTCLAHGPHSQLCVDARYVAAIAYAEYARVAGIPPMLTSTPTATPTRTRAPTATPTHTSTPTSTP